MMNTADRSLALVDYALRRRFVFFSLIPEFKSEKFAKAITDAGGDSQLVEHIREKIGSLNDQISEDPDLGADFAIGHSFFCPDSEEQSINKNWYQSVIEQEIGPLLREYWFDKKISELDEIIEQIK